ncbi:Ger(x)C family spore germination protein [Clostridium sp. 'White wine YQ']|uniref:Ger(x)C family spore germination protein n=1 Tax=Clostridium sp. 'White wine YQ' TaxID=3027474 RepID=UPI002366E8F4|nr:Ger(x)C family spore germination protein [Clostridium sp. 'White wine YQ']MDD7794819.1 Ger(x)C family spore germination protein [Clostridium sp. 'White wine YQ']
MKKIILIMLMVISLNLNGCYNYRDMNKLLFSSLQIYDIDEKEEEYKVYNECFKALRGEGEKAGLERKVILKGRGRSINDALNDLYISAGYQIAYDVNKILIYTESAARYGLDNFTDFPDRDPKPTLRQFMFIYEGDPENFVNISLDDEKYLGEFLENMMLYQNKASNIIDLRLNNYLNNKLIGSRTNVIPIVERTEKSIKTRIGVNGAAVLVDGKMLDKINNEQVEAYNLLNNKLKSGGLFVGNPEHKEKIVSLNILSSKPKRKVYLEDGRIKANIVIDTRLSVNEAQISLRLSDDNIRKEIKDSAEEKIAKKCNELFNKFKMNGIDILNIERELNMKYPNHNIENPISKTDLEVQVNVRIDGSGDIKDTQGK